MYPGLLDPYRAENRELIEGFPELLEQERAILGADPNGPAVLQAAAEAYIRYDEVLSQPGNHVELLHAQLRANDLEDFGARKEPAFSIVVPVAIHNESEESLRNTVARLTNVRGAEQAEIILFGNHPDSQPQSLSLATIVSDIGLSPLKLRFVETAYEKPSMGNIRRDYMDLLLLEGLTRNYSFDHPVLWLDADLEHITKNYADDLTGKIRMRNQAGAVWFPCAQGNVRFGGMSVETQDDATRLLILNELIGRAALRVNPEIVATMYAEESGFAIALGAHAIQFGKRRFIRDFNEAPSAIGNTGIVDSILAGAVEKIAPLSTIHSPGGRDLPSIDKDIFTPTARVIISNRRNLQTAQDFVESMNTYDDPQKAIQRFKRLDQHHVNPYAYKRYRGGYATADDDTSQFYAERHAGPPRKQSMLKDELRVAAIRLWLRGADKLFANQEQYTTILRPILVRGGIDPDAITTDLLTLN